MAVSERMSFTTEDCTEPRAVCLAARHCTVACFDMVGFHARARSLTFDELRVLHHRYISFIYEAVMLHAGMIDKVVGDRVIATWNVPRRCTRAEHRAVQAALAVAHTWVPCVDPMEEPSELLASSVPRNETLGSESTVSDEAERSSPEPELRVGVASGAAIFGNMGS
eukprot:RCo022651